MSLHGWIGVAISLVTLLSAIVGVGYQIGQARQELVDARADLDRHAVLVESLRNDIHSLELYVRELHMAR